MGLVQVALVDETGRTEQCVNGNTHALDSALAAVTPENSKCLAYIDPFGDTVFNQLQMGPFLDEWAALERTLVGDEAQAVGRQVRDLAMRCQVEPHTYLRFFGD